MLADFSTPAQIFDAYIASVSAIQISKVFYRHLLKEESSNYLYNTFTRNSKSSSASGKEVYTKGWKWAYICSE